MKIRWKLLILLLVLSLAPLIALRFMGERAMLSLGEDLARRTETVLIDKAVAEMKRMVEGFARVMYRERELMELVASVQAIEVANRLQLPAPAQADPYFKIGRMHMHGEKAPEGFVPSPRHYRQTRGGRRMPVYVSAERFAFNMESEAPNATVRGEAARLDALAPFFRTLYTEHEDLVLWQTVTLEDGLHAVFPALLGGMGTPNPKESEWYLAAKAAHGPVWTRPMAAAGTQRILLRVAAPVSESGRFVGVTSVVLPLSDVLTANPHTQAVSLNTRFMLVKPGNATDPECLEVIGLDSAPADTEKKDMGSMMGMDSEMGMRRRWLAPLEAERIPASPGTALAPVLEDILHGQSGVRRVEHNGEDSIWAYGILDQYKTALIMIAPTADVTREAGEAKEFVVSRIGRQISQTGLVLGVVIVLVAGVAFVTSRAVTTPLRRVADAVRQVAAGDWQTRVDLKSCDEIGDLACTFNEMIPQLHERYEMKAAMDVAQEVQRSLLPKHAPGVLGADVAGIIHYCDETGGDYYDFLPSPCENCISLAVGDVTGHGIPAALLMAAVRAYVRSRADEPGTPAEIIAHVNRLITEDCWETNRFVTMFFMLVDAPSCLVRWVRAGHEPALVYDPAGDAFSELVGPGMALGLDPDAEFTDQEKRLPPGAIVLIGTDGIREAHDPTGEQFGLERFKQAVRENAGAPAEEIALAVVQAVEAFQGDAPREDDITLVVVKFV